MQLNLLNIYRLGAVRFVQAQKTRPHPRRSQAREHHVGRPRSSALQSQSNRLWLGIARKQSRTVDLFTVEVL